MRATLQLLSRYSTLSFSVLFLILVAILFYTRGIESENHLAHLDSIDHLETVEKNYNIALLFSRQNIRENLDRLLQVERQYSELLKRIRNSNIGLSQGAKQQFQQQRSQIVHLLEKKRQLVAQFSANRSIHSNSLLYLPRISQQMEDYCQQQARSIPMQAHDLFEKVLLYLSAPKHQGTGTILSTAHDLLSQIQPQDLAQPEINEAKSVLNYIKIVIRSFDTMNRSLDEALAIELESSIAQLREIYLQGYQQLEQRSRTGNYILMFITLFLFIGIIHTLRRVRIQFIELRQLEAALDQHAIVSTADIYGNINYANDKFCEISGFAREELLGQNHRLVKSERHPASFYQNLWDTISSGEVWQNEVWNRKKGGDGEYCVYGTIVPFSDIHGKITKYVSICTDLTQLKESEQELKESQEKFQGLVEDIGEGYVLFSADPHNYVLRYVSPEFEPLFGILPETALDHSLVELIAWPTESRNLLIQCMEHTLEQGRSTPFEISFNHAITGELHTISITQHQVERDGTVIAVEGIIQDITERLQAEKRQFEAFQAGVSEMSASVMHSIGNITTGLTGTLLGVEKKSDSLQTLSQTMKKVTEKHQQGKIKQEDVGQLLTLIESTISKALYGKSGDNRGIHTLIGNLKKGLQDIKTSISAYRGVSQQGAENDRLQLRKLSADALQLIHSALDQEQISSAIEIPAELEVEAPINQSLQLLVNLINNSTQAILQRRIDEPEHTGTITLRGEQNGQGEIRLTIEDDGCGITEDQLSQLFNHGYSTKTDGSGFGLHMAGNLMNKLNGSITADSDGLNQGARIILTFPASSSNR